MRQPGASEGSAVARHEASICDRERFTTEIAEFTEIGIKPKKNLGELRGEASI
jgi:hypothetical protein